MKTLFALALLALLFSSCKKCYQCSTTVTISGAYVQTHSATTTTNVCGQTQAGIEAYMNAGTTQTVTNVGVNTVTETAVTICQ